MSLNLSKLEKVRELAGGIVQARCPACAEGGHDRTGEHLRMYPDGRFGCCVHPKDGDHRKRIFALAGDRGKLPFHSPGTFNLRVKTPPALTVSRSVKAALVFPLQPSPGLRPAEVRPAKSPVPTGEGRGTLGTPEAESEIAVPNVPSPSVTDFGTFGTGFFNPRAYAREGLPPANIDMVDFHKKLKDSECAVPSVPTAVVDKPLSVAGERLPYFTPGGTLVIPFDSPERYRWWKPDGERLTVAETLREVNERMKHAVTV